MSLDLSSSFHQFRISMAESSKNGTITFDHFKLDLGNLMLYRDGDEIHIAPKIVKTLAVLVESAGTIINKEDLIERVWDDSIVEEANLTQYLYLLRKTLGNMPDGRPYIETLRRRGYRFNGKVELHQAEPPRVEVAALRRESEPSPSFGGIEREGNVLRVVDWQTAAPPSEDFQPAVEPATLSPASTVPPRRSFLPRVALTAGMLLLIGIGGIFLWPRVMPAVSDAESQKELSVVKLTNGLRPFGATISPDGNAFAYSEDDGEISRFYVQQTGQTSRIEIATAADKLFGGKTFSPDGQSIYYVVIDKKAGAASLFRIPSMGGAPIKILDDVYGPVSLSPDGNELVFLRRNPTNESWLMIAGKDGRAERVLLQRKSPNSLGTPAWSPDGKKIAFPELDRTNGETAGKLQLKVAQVATGQVTPFSSERWENILRVAWYPDGSGLVINGTRENDGLSTRRDQIYFVSYPEGVSRRLTTDGNRHEPESLGITKKGEILAVPANRSAQVWVMNADGNTSTAVQLTRGSADGRAGLGPLPEGRFGYLARTADEISIMLANADGSNAKQLATGFQFIEELRSDPLGRFFVFSAKKDGRTHLYRIDVDGGEVKQLTFGDRELDSTISPEGKYLTYDSLFVENGVEVVALKRIPTDGGEPVMIKTKGCFIPTYSPDGSMLSCMNSEQRGIVIVSAADGSELEHHSLPIFAEWNFGFGWTPDGSGLIYIVNEKGVSNLWVQPRDGSKPRSLTNFSSGIIYRYAFSPDGSKLYLARGYPTQDAILIRNFK